MSQYSDEPSHPGAFIRTNVLPSNMSVTEAAKRLDVGRPALSNLLNGNSSLSPDMAVRLERTFGASRQKLLDMQAAFDQQNRRGAERSIAAKAYVPAFLTIKARQIHEWPNLNLEARHLLPVLLRKLVHSTGQRLSEVDFPGYDNAERKGNDGKTVAGVATPWVPIGTCYWEFGVNQDPKQKAEGDYAARIRSIPASERLKCTFIFVTPRNWPGKDNWAAEKEAAGEWNVVRAFDASDLEQWLEQSISAQMWFAEILGMTVGGFETLDQFWETWSAASEPKLAPAVFESAITTHCEKLKNWLERESKEPFVVTADSKGEALALLACLFRDRSIDSRFGDLATIFKSPESLRRLLPSTAPFIPIVYTQETELELTTTYRHRHCIVVRPRNAVNSSPNIDLGRLDHESFLNALGSMGIEREDAERLARESGCSPTILRRRLSQIDAIRTPPWSEDSTVATTLVPMVFVGVWQTRSEADLEIISLLGNRDYKEIERSVAPLLDSDDAPLWSRGQYCGVVSKIDALFAIRKHVTANDLREFMELAEYVLSEVDPARDLPEDKRWAASVYGKVRDHSDALRESISETLVILSVHGDDLFRDRYGFSVKDCISSLVHRLLTPLTLDKLYSQKDDLPGYAEAAPEVFLRVIEDDLKRDEPVILGTLEPADAGPFSSPSRTGLLWALECLAWRNLLRVSLLLAQMSRVEISDNWANKPINSLLSIYRSWMPQTAASLEERIASLELLANRFPDIGWKICMAQLVTGSQTSDPCYSPRWRTDASGAGQPVKTQSELNEFIAKALQLVLNWPKHDGQTLQDLVERIQIVPEDAQSKIWELIEIWADSESDDAAKAKLAEAIRRFAFTRRGKSHDLDDAIKYRARSACSRLESVDPIIRHAWLFANDWIELSAEELEDEDIDAAYTRHEEKIERFRTEAMLEIWEANGFDGAKQLLFGGGVAYLVGKFLSRIVEGAPERAEILRKSLVANGDHVRELDGLMQGFLGQIKQDARAQVISDVVADTNSEQSARLFRCAPIRKETWRLMDDYGNATVGQYWQEVIPYPERYSREEAIELIDRLLDAQRPRAAFNAVKIDWSRIETSRLNRLLLAVATVDEEPEGYYQISPYYISKALKSLDGRAGVSVEEMAQLEFLYITALDHREHPISNIERQVGRSPIMFVQLLALIIKRDDGGQDPAGWKVKDSQRELKVSAGIRILEKIKLTPDPGPNGSVDADALYAWINEARQLCAEYGRSEIGDQYIGQLLSREKPDDGDVWPSVPVCEAMERVASSEIGLGFSIGVQNAVGAQIRGKGGTQERERAEKFRIRANNLRLKYPYMYRVLEGIAVEYEHQAKWHDDNEEIRGRLR